MYELFNYHINPRNVLLDKYTYTNTRLYPAQV